MPGEQEKYLIITADDFGYSDERDDGIVDCFKGRAISNVSLMVNGFSVENAVKVAKEAGLPIGLHLNLTEGTPVSTPVPRSLIGPDGYMLGKMGFREAVNHGLVQRSEVVHEIQAQIDKFEKLTGSKPVNIDGHQHVHVYPGICEIFSKVLHNNGIELTRLPVESTLNESKGGDLKAAFKNQVIQQSRDMEHILRESHIRYPSFTGLKTMGRGMTVQILQDCILDAYQMKYSTIQSPGNSKQTCELMVHPGKKTGHYGGCGNGPDSFSQSTDREHEMTVLMSQEMLDFYKRYKIHLISFKDLKVG